MKDWSKTTTYLAVGLMTVGFVLIVLAWNGAASRDFIQGQFPYLLSGGLAGIALIGAGLTLALVQELRRTAGGIESKIEWLAEVLSERAGAAGPTAVPEDASLVVAGRTSYHSPDCHLVEGRNDLQAMAIGTAKDRGLAPCRICTPDISPDASEEAS